LKIKIKDVSGEKEDLSKDTEQEYRK